MISFDILFNKSSNEGIRFFILDTRGVGHKYDDQDFLKYSWSPKQYNRVRPGDVFIYRRPNSKSQKESFYFFGAGIIGQINPIDTNIVQAKILDPVIFDHYLYPIDLFSFKWTFKSKKRDDWQYFFNQYGMMEIHRDDFLGLLKLQANTQQEIETLYEEIDKEIEVNLYQQIHQQNFRVENKYLNQKIRGSAQAIFAKEVKGNYLNKCCITGISTQRLLIASHIVPWSVDEDNRLNPANGLCLSPLFDRAFDLGLITVNADKKIIISTSIQKDKALFEYFKDFAGKKIYTHVSIPPKAEFLSWHQQNVFDKLQLQKS
jgi:putative restriction endonuclease